MRQSAGLGAVLGGVIYASAGAVMAAQNLGWWGLRRDANSLFVWLGAGLALVVLGFAVVLGRDIRDRGWLGRVVTVAGVAAPLILLLSLLIEFAIFGTLATFIALLAFTRMVQRDRLLPRPDVRLLAVATAASITWNTETPSAALLIVVGLVLSWISYRALLLDRWAVSQSS